MSGHSEHRYILESVHFQGLKGLTCHSIRTALTKSVTSLNGKHSLLGQVTSRPMGCSNQSHLTFVTHPAFHWMLSISFHWLSNLLGNSWPIWTQFQERLLPLPRIFLFMLSSVQNLINLPFTQQVTRQPVALSFKCVMSWLDSRERDENITLLKTTLRAVWILAVLVCSQWAVGALVFEPSCTPLGTN